MRWIVSCSVLAVLGLVGLLAFPNLHSKEITSAEPSLSLGLANIADYKDFTAHRASSADPTGGNNDKRFIPPGQTLALAKIQGAGQIVHLWCTMAWDNTPDFQDHLPRWVVLRMYWDGTDIPSVEAPVGDFFGSGHGRLDDILSVPIQSFRDGAGRNSYFPMPFDKSARITVTNEHPTKSVRIYWNIDYQLYPTGKLPRPMPRFHASYRQEFPTTKGKDYTILEATGRGHFVGCVLSVEKADNPGWFGEGDEIITIDGEKTPRMWGTGTEDYFGTAFAPHVYSGLYTGFTSWTGCMDKGARMTGYRFHLPDPIPFQQSIIVQIEHAGDRSQEFSDHYSSVAYWYQSAPHKSFPMLPPGSERIPISDRRPP